MARGFRVNFSVPEVKQTLNSISAFNARAALKIEDAVSKSTKAIRAGAARRVRRRTGALKKAIRSRFDKKSVIGYVSAKQPYAHLIEFGAKPHPAKDPRTGRPYTSYTPEMPFMRPAYEEEKPNLIRNLKEAVRRA